MAATVGLGRPAGADTTTNHPIYSPSVDGFGDAASYGAPSGQLNAGLVAMAPTPDGKGYWLAGAQGGVYSYGDAVFHGSAGPIQLAQPVVGMAATPDGGGYWLVAKDGGVFSFGDARFYGSTGGQPLNQPITGMAATPDGAGYWLVAKDGGIFTFGDARFYGSTGGQPLNQPVTGMAATPDGGGYWLVAKDGGIFTFGDARFYGSTGGQPLNQPVTGMAATPDGGGYWLSTTAGKVYPFGDAADYGSESVPVANQPVVSVAPTPDGKGYWLATSGLTAACTGAQLSVSTGRVPAAAGHEGVALEFTDTSGVDCTLQGYPGATGVDANGDRVAPAQRTPSGYMGGLQPGANPPLVTLGPGQTASALVEGTDVPQGNETSCPRLSGMLVTPPNTTDTVHVDAVPPDCSGLQVHPVVAGTTGSQTT